MKNLFIIYFTIVTLLGVKAQDYEYKINVRNAGKWDMVNTKTSIADQIHDSLANKPVYTLPPQTGHGENFLSTNGIQESWKALPLETDPVFVSHPAHNVVSGGDGTKFLSDDGSYKAVSANTAGVLLSASVVMTPAQMGNQSDPYYTTSHNYTQFVAMLPAPGSGKVIFPYKAIIVNTGSSAGAVYAVNPNNGTMLVLKYGNNSNYLLSDELMGSAIAGYNPLYTAVPFSNTFSMGDYINAPLAVAFDVNAIWSEGFRVTGSEPNLKIILYYTILDVN